MSAKRAIHILQGCERDWVVREDGGRELGHYPTRFEAEGVGRKLAQKRRVELVVQVDGKPVRSKPARGWLARLFGR